MAFSNISGEVEGDVAHDAVDSGNPVNTLDNYQISSKAPTYFFRDDIGTSVVASSSVYGLINHNGYHTASLSTPNNIQNAANNDVGQVQTGIYPSAEMMVMRLSPSFSRIKLAALLPADPLPIMT